MYLANTNLFPAGVNALRRNSYETKYIPVAGTSAKLKLYEYVHCFRSGTLSTPRPLLSVFC